MHVTLYDQMVARSLSLTCVMISELLGTINDEIVILPTQNVIESPF